MMRTVLCSILYQKPQKLLSKQAPLLKLGSISGRERLYVIYWHSVGLPKNQGSEGTSISAIVTQLLKDEISRLEVSYEMVLSTIGEKGSLRRAVKLGR